MACAQGAPYAPAQTIDVCSIRCEKNENVKARVDEQATANCEQEEEHAALASRRARGPRGAAPAGMVSNGQGPTISLTIVELGLVVLSLLLIL